VPPPAPGAAGPFPDRARPVGGAPTSLDWRRCHAASATKWTITTALPVPTAPTNPLGGSRSTPARQSLNNFGSESPLPPGSTRQRGSARNGTHRWMDLRSHVPCDPSRPQRTCSMGIRLRVYPAAAATATPTVLTTVAAASATATPINAWRSVRPAGRCRSPRTGPTWWPLTATSSMISDDGRYIAFVSASPTWSRRTPTPALTSSAGTCRPGARGSDASSSGRRAGTRP
jgi:hypothetical protein